MKSYLHQNLNSLPASREAAYTYAIASAGAAYAVTAACARGNISTCGCDVRHKTAPVAEGAPEEPWKWGGCSADVDFGMRYARRFMDARELERDSRTLMNLHNNRAGRTVRMSVFLLAFKLWIFHILVGEENASHRLQVPWRKWILCDEDLLEEPAAFPADRRQADAKISKSQNCSSRQRQTWTEISNKQVRKSYTSSLNKFFNRNTLSFFRKKHTGVARAPKPVLHWPKRMELIYLEASPNYCERSLQAGSQGTAGRICQHGGHGPQSCDLLCCGRGHNTQHIRVTKQCRCQFRWCCEVKCDECDESYEEFTCK